MPDIPWTADFRLAVAWRIALRFAPLTGEAPSDDDCPAFLAFAVISNVAAADVDFLNEYCRSIEAALGCTLAEVKEEMGRDGK